MKKIIKVELGGAEIIEALDALLEKRFAALDARLMQVNEATILRNGTIKMEMIAEATSVRAMIAIMNNVDLEFDARLGKLEKIVKRWQWYSDCFALPMQV